jgi:ABC-type bacteriocin/lantibiotic exporter with double-glycine peptidase domain
LALLVLGVALVLRGDLTLGGMLAANLVALAALAPIGNLASLGQSWQLARVQLERMYDVLDSPAEPAGGVQLAGRTPLALELTGISAGYSTNEAVLQGISLRLPAGRKIAVVGRTGSGKTTLALVVLGLLAPSGGQIAVDGHALSEVDLPELRTAFGAVLQNLSLFSGSIADNIALGRESLTQQDIERAAQTAALHEEVLAMPMGYQTQVGEGGQALSAGQRQRVALARALVHRPRLLVLDEATSQLDPLTERAVDEALDRLEVTRLVISHRVSAVANADEIVVLERGSVVERGRHDELLSRQGHYYGLFAGVIAPHQKVPPQNGELDVRRTASLERRGLPG